MKIEIMMDDQKVTITGKDRQEVMVNGVNIIVTEDKPEQAPADTTCHDGVCKIDYDAIRETKNELRY